MFLKLSDEVDTLKKKLPEVKIFKKSQKSHYLDFIKDSIERESI